MIEKELPIDIDAERHTLGACLAEREAILAARKVVSMEDFYLEKHRQVYAAILECLSQRVPPDLATVATELRKRNQLKEIGGPGFLAELVADVPQVMHVEYYARTVAETATARRLIELGGRLTAAAYDRKPDDILKELQAQLQLERHIATGEWSGKATDGLDIWRMQYPPLVFTVDKILPSGTFLLTGKSKSRKSWMALNLAYAVAAGGRALGYFKAVRGDALYIDLEMGERRINRRLRVLYPEQPPPQGVSFVEKWPIVGQGFEEELESYLEANPYTRLVVVDTLVQVRPHRNRTEDPYEQDKAFAQVLTDLCHGKDITLLLVHHSRKMAGVDVVDDASGTMGLTGGVDNVGSLSRTTEKDGGLLRLVGRDIEIDDDLDLKWDGRLAQWNYQPVNPSLVSPERQLIQNLLANQPGLYPKQIAERMRKPEHSIRRLLADMKKDCQVESMSGQYYLVDTETPPHA
jgi:hypothetical protein